MLHKVAPYNAMLYCMFYNKVYKELAGVHSVCLLKELPLTWPDSFITSLIIHRDIKTRLHWNKCLNIWMRTCSCCVLQIFWIIIELPLCTAASLPGDKHWVWFIAHIELLSSICCNRLTLTCSRNVCLVQTFHTVIHRGNMSLWYFRIGQRQRLSDMITKCLTPWKTIRFWVQSFP